MLLVQSAVGREDRAACRGALMTSELLIRQGEMASGPVGEPWKLQSLTGAWVLSQ